MLRAYVRELKDNPCTDCGVVYHYSQMQFDHVRGEKLKDINRMMHDRHSIETIMKEIEKCELVCANCHALRTWRRSVEEDLQSQMDVD